MVKPKTQVDFNSEDALKVAKGYDFASRHLENIKRNCENEQRSNSNISLQYVDNIVGLVSASTLLEALAIEIVLKALLKKLNIEFGKQHNHEELYKLLESEQDILEEIYESKLKGFPAANITLREALAFSKDIFIQWRYSYENRERMGASMGEMYRAFKSLVERLENIGELSS